MGFKHSAEDPRSPHHQNKYTLRSKRFSNVLSKHQVRFPETVPEAKHSQTEVPITSDSLMILHNQSSARQAGRDGDAAAAETISDLVQEEGNCVVTTDMGNEFRGLEAALPGRAVHRQKDPSDRNATAVVDSKLERISWFLVREIGMVWSGLSSADYWEGPG